MAFKKYVQDTPSRYGSSACFSTAQKPIGILFVLAVGSRLIALTMTWHGHLDRVFEGERGDVPDPVQTVLRNGGKVFFRLAYQYSALSTVRVMMSGVGTSRP